MARTLGKPKHVESSQAMQKVAGHMVGGNDYGASKVVVRHRDFIGWEFALTFAPSGNLVEFRVSAIGVRPGAHDVIAGKEFGLPLPEGPAVTARLLRRIPVGEVEAFARTCHAKSLALVYSRKPRALQEVWGDAEARRPAGVGHRNDLDYARYAELYVELASTTHRPNVEMQQELERRGDFLSESAIRSLISEARRRNLLTPTVRGKQGGQLAEKAYLVLQQGEHTDGKH